MAKGPVIVYGVFPELSFGSQPVRLTSLQGLALAVKTHKPVAVVLDATAQLTGVRKALDAYRQDADLYVLTDPRDKIKHPLATMCTSPEALVVALKLKKVDVWLRQESAKPLAPTFAATPAPPQPAFTTRFTSITEELASPSTPSRHSPTTRTRFRKNEPAPLAFAPFPAPPGTEHDEPWPALAAARVPKLLFAGPRGRQRLEAMLEQVQASEMAYRQGVVAQDVAARWGVATPTFKICLVNLRKVLMPHGLTLLGAGNTIRLVKAMPKK